ncbi:MAG: AMP-binding protein, partial [Planctomycetota bacterium]
MIISAPNDPPRAETLVALLQARACSTPDAKAYAFLADGEAPAGALTYGALDRRARAVAARLREAAEPGARALLLYDPGLEFLPAFFGCLYAGLVAVPLHAPHQNRNLERVLTVQQDADAALGLIAAEKRDDVARWTETLPGLGALTWIATDAPDEAADPLPASACAPAGDDLAFLQYTSGSTSAPKGVMVGHGNLLHNLDEIHRCIHVTDDSIFVTWLPHFHDLGLIFGLLQPCFNGVPCHLMPPAAFLQRPLRWLRAISAYSATHSPAPNFAYDLCVDRIPSEKRQGLDLSRWKLAVNAAEPVRADTLRRFTEAYAPFGFRSQAWCPCFGLAEATLKVA